MGEEGVNAKLLKIVAYQCEVRDEEEREEV